jgi:bacteriocin-like protein
VKLNDLDKELTSEELANIEGGQIEIQSWSFGASNPVHIFAANAGFNITTATQS